MPEDIFGLGDPDDDAQKTPALVVGAPLRNHELEAVAWAHLHSRAPEFWGSHEVTFIDEFGELEDECAIRFQAEMKWPVRPSVAEVDAFTRRQKAKLDSFYWQSLREARAKDDELEAAAERDMLDKAGRPQGGTPVRRP